MLPHVYFLCGGEALGISLILLFMGVVSCTSMVYCMSGIMGCVVNMVLLDFSIFGIVNSEDF